MRGPDAADAASVCVVGNLNTDLIIRGVESLPSWGTEVVGATSAAFPAGQAGYLALALRQLGVPTRVIGSVGGDAAGRQIKGALSESGADISGIEVDQDGRTGITVAAVRPDGERAFISDLGCSNAVDRALVFRQWERTEACAVLCLVGLFNLAALDFASAMDLLAAARKEGCSTVLDSGWDPGGWAPETIAAFLRLLSLVDVFLPNQDEAAALSGSLDPAVACELLQDAGPATVVVKCGADGSWGRDGRRSHRVPASTVTVADTVGAGDEYDAAFLKARLAGDDLEAAMQFATTAAGLYVSRPRDRFPTTEEVRQSMHASRRSEAP